MKTRWKAFTDAGSRNENQDAYATYTFERGEVLYGGRGELFAVMDGMGGHKAGREAALEVGDMLARYFGPQVEFNSEDSAQAQEALRTLFESINQDLKARGLEDEDRTGWGCTASALVVHEDRCMVAHAGDTRIYRLRDGLCRLLTEDQNIAFQLYKHEQINYEEYLKSGGHNKLLSFMGQGDQISIKTDSCPILEGDLFLICSDGLNQFAQIRDMEQIARELSVVSQPDRMQTLYDKLSQERIRPQQAEDNVTFLLIEIVSDEVIETSNAAELRDFEIQGNAVQADS